MIESHAFVRVPMSDSLALNMSKRSKYWRITLYQMRGSRQDCTDHVKSSLKGSAVRERIDI